MTGSGLVLTLGYGETGRLGHGDEEDVLQPKASDSDAGSCSLILAGGGGDSRSRGKRKERRGEYQ